MNKTMTRRLSKIERHNNDLNFNKPYSELTKEYPSKEWAKIHQL